MDARFHRADLDARDDRDLFVGEAFDVAQEQGGPLLLGHEAERLLDRGDGLAVAHEIREVRPEEYDEAGEVTALAYREFAPRNDPDWEEYLGDRVIPHLGILEEYTVQAATTFPVLIGTMLRSISLMEAAADECYELSGDTEALMRCANLLPYVMHTFSQVSTSELARL